MAQSKLLTTSSCTRVLALWHDFSLGTIFVALFSPVFHCNIVPGYLECLRLCLKAVHVLVGITGTAIIK